MKLSDSTFNDYIIQPARKADIPLLDTIEAAAGTIFPSGSIPEDVLAERVPYDILMDAMDQSRLLVAVDSAQTPVGFAFWQDVDGSALLALIEVTLCTGKKGLARPWLRKLLSK